MTDNTGTMMCIKNQGSTVSGNCNHVRRLIWLWALERKNWLSTAHFPEVQNVEADKASTRFNEDTE